MISVKKALHAGLFMAAAAAAGFFAYASSDKLYRGAGSEEREDGKNVFSKELFDVGNARSFAVTWRNASATMVKDGKGRWVVTEREDALADTAKVIKFLTDLSEMRRLKTLRNADEESLKELAVADGEGIRVCVRDEKGNALFDAVMGRGHAKVGGEQVGNYNVGTYDGRYVRMLSGAAAGEVILVPGIFEACDPAPEKWLERLRLPKLDDVMQMNVSGIADGKRTTVWRAVNTPDGFAVIQPQQGAVNQKAFSDMVKVLNSPFGVEVIKKEKNRNVTFTNVLQIVLRNGCVYELSFCTSGNLSLLKLDASYEESATERLQGEGDEEFAARKKHLAGQAEVFRECFAGRIYVSSAAMAQMMLKAGLPANASAPAAKAKNVFEMKNGQSK